MKGGKKKKNDAFDHFKMAMRRRYASYCDRIEMCARMGSFMEAHEMRVRAQEIKNLLVDMGEDA